MSEYNKYKTVDCLGWWEDKFGNRIKVIGLDGDWRAFLFKENGCVKGACFKIMSIRKHLPDCTGWDWQPEKWEDADPSEITLDMLPIKARFRNELTEDWRTSMLYGYWRESGLYLCASRRFWKYCQIRKEEQ